MRINIKKFLKLILFSLITLSFVACKFDSKDGNVDIIDTNDSTNDLENPYEEDFNSWADFSNDHNSPCEAQYPNTSSSNNKVYLDVQGLDVEAGSKFALTPIVKQNSGNYVAMPASFIDKNGCTTLKAYNSYGYSDLLIYNNNSAGSFNLTLENSGITNINQVCKIVKYIPSKYKNIDLGLGDTKKMYLTNYQNPVVKINCKTPVKITKLIDTSEEQIVDVQDKNIRLFEVKMQGEHGFINSKSLDFEFISGDDLADLDEEQGLIKFNKPGRLKVKVQPNSDYYSTDENVIYDFLAQQRDLTYQNTEIGQSILLPIGSKYQVVVPNNKTIVRALVYAKNSNTLITDANLTIKNNNSTYTVDLKCPQKAREGEFETYHYALEDTCYTILDHNELDYLKQNSIFEFNINGQKKSIMPRIYPQRTIKIKMFKGKNSNGTATLPKAEDVQKYIKQIYPFSSVNVIPMPEINLSTDLNQALDTLTQLQYNQGDAGQYHYYGFVPQASCYGQIGLGWIGSPTAVGINSTCKYAVDDTMMHELGHNLSLLHAPCVSFKGKVSGIDNFWKLNYWDGSEMADLSGSPLFIQDSETIVSPYIGYVSDTSKKTYRKDLMSYCHGVRINKHSYKQVAEFTQTKDGLYPIAKENQAFISQPLAMGMRNSTSSKGYKFNLSGEILENKILLNNLKIYPGEISNSYIHGGIDYSVEIKIADMTFVYPLALRRLDHSPKLLFDLDLPYFSKIDSIKFMHGEAEILHEFKKPRIIAFTEQSLQRPQSLKKLMKYANQTIYWQNNKYKYMRVVYIAPDDTREVLELIAVGGVYKLPNKQNLNYKTGKLEIVLFEGLNTHMEFIDLK